MAKFNEMLKYLRQRAGYSQQDLADLLKISKSTIGMYEQGRRSPDYETLEKIADIFNVDMNFLMGGKTKESTPEYYINPETAKLAQELFENHDLRILFDAARDSDPKDLQMAADLLKRLKGTDD